MIVMTCVDILLVRPTKRRINNARYVYIHDLFRPVYLYLLLGQRSKAYLTNTCARSCVKRTVGKPYSTRWSLLFVLVPFERL